MEANTWNVGYFMHHGKFQKSEEVVDFWYRHKTIEEAAETARWLIGALGVASGAAADSERELSQFHTPNLPAGGGVGWQVGPYEVALQDTAPPNKPSALNPMGRLLMVAGEIHVGRVYGSVSGFVATAGYNLTTELRTLMAWDVADLPEGRHLPGVLPRLTDKGRSWLNTYGEWKVEYYKNYADIPHAYEYFTGDEAKARAYAERLAGKWNNVSVRSPLGKRDILASDALDIRR